MTVVGDIDMQGKINGDLVIGEDSNDFQELEKEIINAYTGVHFSKGFNENFLLANKIPILKWKINIIAVAAVAIAKPILP